MTTLYERLKFLCDEKNVSGAKMCTDIGYSKSLMTELKSGRKKSVSAEVAYKLANYFEVSSDYLLGKTDDRYPGDNHPADDEQQAKVALFGGDTEVTDEMWSEVKAFAEFLKAKQKR